MPKIEPLPGVRFRADRNVWEAAVVVAYTSTGQPSKRVTQRFTTVTEANEWKAANDTAKRRGILNEDSVMTLEAFCKDWLNGKRRIGRGDKTMHDYETNINKFILPKLGHLRLTDLRPMVVKRWADLLMAETTQHSVWRAKKYLSSILEEACRLELIPRNPAFGVKVEKPVIRQASRWTREEAAKVLTHCADPDNQNRTRYYTGVGLMTGLSREELMGLRNQDITWQGTKLRGLEKLKPSHLHLFRAESPHWGKGSFKALLKIEIHQVVIFIKGKYIIKPTPKNETRERELYVEGRTMLFLYWQKKLRTLLMIASRGKWQDHDLVFPGVNGTPFPEGRLRLEFMELCEAAGVKTIQLNKLRATYNSVASLDFRVPAKIMQDRMGHTDERTQMAYYQQVGDADRRALAISPSALYGAKIAPRGS